MEGQILASNRISRKYHISLSSISKPCIMYMIFMLQHKSTKFTHNHTEHYMIRDLYGSGIHYLYVTWTLHKNTLVSVHCVYFLNTLLEDTGFLFFSHLWYLSIGWGIWGTPIKYLLLLITLIRSWFSINHSTLKKLINRLSLFLLLSDSWNWKDVETWSNFTSRIMILYRFLMRQLSHSALWGQYWTHHTCAQRNAYDMAKLKLVFKMML